MNFNYICKMFNEEVSCTLITDDGTPVVISYELVYNPEFGFHSGAGEIYEIQMPDPDNLHNTYNQ